MDFTAYRDLEIELGEQEAAKDEALDRLYRARSERALRAAEFDLWCAESEVERLQQAMEVG